MKSILTAFILLITSFTFSQETDNRIHFKVDQLATYHGGYESFNKYISENINCKIKINRKEQNTVQLRFIVEKDGKVTKIEILSEKPFVCSEQIADALKKCPAWKPALKDNLPVRSIVQMDVNFEK